MDIATRDKWDAASRTLDLFSFAEDRRLGPHKQRLFANIRGATLMVGAGTGNDFKFFPPGMHVVAIDISPKMLERAARKTASYPGSIELREMDVCDLEFPDATFDTVATACTFCSVLKPGGQLLMFEHVRSAIGPLGILMDLMTPLCRRVGPNLTATLSAMCRRRASGYGGSKTSISTS